MQAAVQAAVQAVVQAAVQVAVQAAVQAVVQAGLQAFSEFGSDPTAAEDLAGDEDDASAGSRRVAVFIIFVKCYTQFKFILFVFKTQLFNKHIKSHSSVECLQYTYSLYKQTIEQATPFCV